MKEFSLHSYLKTKPSFQNCILQNKEPGGHLKMSAETLYAMKRWKITVKLCGS